MSTTNCKNLAVVGVFLASAFLFVFTAMAAEEAQIEAAIKDLSSATGQSISSEGEARTVCNEEKYFEICADIGKKHTLYEEEELKTVDSFLTEVKGKILDDIKNCTTEECLVKVAGELAAKIQTKNPTLATNLQITTKVAEEKRAIAEAAKEAGVNFKDCESMDPDSASVDLLRKCARLAKDTRIQKYIPEEKRVLADQFGDTTIKLREGLTTGKYQCGDGTLEGCGNFCLNPTAETKAAGIPAVCKQIAAEIFGAEGVKELERAHQQVDQVKDYYSKKFILTLPNGKELAGEGQIRNACDEAFSGQINNLATAKACGDFAVKNGFASQIEVDRGLKLLESFNQRGQNANFDQCITNPVACRDFIPEDERGQFDAGNQIFEIMKTEIGFDPSQCERGAVDETIGVKCFEGSKRALTKIESLGLAQKSREARFIIEDIKRHVTEGESFIERKDEFKQVFSQQGGPGGCRSEGECFSYCSDPAHGPECIAFGAKQGRSGFQGQEAVQKFQEYNQNIQKPGLSYTEYKDEFSQFPGQGPYPGFRPPGQGGFPPGQIPGFGQSGPGFNFGPVGPSPDCFAAIQSGDFVKAKSVCDTSSSNLPIRQGPICPASPYVECPAGQYRDSFQNRDGCWIDGPCKPSSSSGPYPTYGEYKGDANSCPGFAHSKWDATGKRFCRLNGVNSCQYNYPAYLDQANYAPGNCPPEYSGTYTPYPTFPGGSYPACPSGQWWDYTFNRCTSTPACGAGYYWDSGTNSCRSSGSSACSQSLIRLLGDGCHQMYNDSSGRQVYCDGPMTKSAKEGDTVTTAGCSGGGNYSYSPYPSSTGGGGGSGLYSCFYPNATKNGQAPGYTVWCERDYYNCHQGEKSGAAVSLDGLTLGAPSTCESGWPNTSYTPYPTYSTSPSFTPGTSSCPSGYHYHGESGGYCMNDQENYGGTCYNSAGTARITCPAQPSYSPYPSPSVSLTSGGTCPSGSHTMYVNSAGGYCMSDADLSKCGPLNSTSVSNFGSCSSYTGSTTSYSPYPTSSYGSSACSSSLINLLGSGCHYMFNDSSNRAVYCDGPMTKSAKEGDTATTSGCSASGATYSSYPTGTYSYSPYPTSSTSSSNCPSGSHSMASYCMSDGDGTKCGPLNSTSVSNFGSCSSYTGSTTSYSPYPSYTYTYTPYPTSTYTSTPYPTETYTSTPYPTSTYTYTPYPTTETTYTPAPTAQYSPSATYQTCPSGQYWSGSSCVTGTSMLGDHYMAMHCQQLGREWNGSTCQAKGLLARIYENNFATILRLFRLTP